MLKSEQLYRDLENESALFDGENTTTQKGSEESLSHMQNWSLIGAALRNELPSKVNMSLADNVMAQIKNENIKPEPAKIKEISLITFIQDCLQEVLFWYRPGSTSSICCSNYHHRLANIQC